VHPCSSDRGRSGPCFHHQHGSFGRFSCVQHAQPGGRRPAPAFWCVHRWSRRAQLPDARSRYACSRFLAFLCICILAFSARGWLHAGAWLNGTTARERGRARVRIPNPSPGGIAYPAGDRDDVDDDPRARGAARGQCVRIPLLAVGAAASAAARGARSSQPGETERTACAHAHRATHCASA
jgi:hypothetical protein